MPTVGKWSTRFSIYRRRRGGRRSWRRWSRCRARYWRRNWRRANWHELWWRNFGAGRAGRKGGSTFVTSLRLRFDSFERRWKRLLWMRSGMENSGRKGINCIWNRVITWQTTKWPASPSGKMRMRWGWRSYGTSFEMGWSWGWTCTVTTSMEVGFRTTIDPFGTRQLWRVRNVKAHTSRAFRWRVLQRI